MDDAGRGTAHVVRLERACLTTSWPSMSSAARCSRGATTPASGGPSRDRRCARSWPTYCPTGHATLILGPHGADLVEAVSPRRPSDGAGPLRLRRQRAHRAVRRQACRSSLVRWTGWRTPVSPSYDVVVAADGLDRVLGYDSNELNWSQRLDALAAVTAPGAVLVLGLENEFSLTNLLDRRPADERHADDEWRPLHDDPTRPVSASSSRLSWPGSASRTRPPTLVLGRRNAVRAGDRRGRCCCTSGTAPGTARCGGTGSFGGCRAAAGSDR